MALVLKQNFENIHMPHRNPASLLYIFLFCIFATGCVTPPPKPIAGTIEESQFQLLNTIKKGKDFAAAQRYKEAEEEFRHAISLDNTNSGLYNNLGFVLLGLKKYDGAQENFEKALELDPANLNAKLNLAHTLYKKELYNDALSLYDKIVQFHLRKEDSRAKQKIQYAIPQADLALAYQNMSLIYDINKKYELAEKYGEAAFETEPNTYYAEQYAKLLLSLNHPQKAEEFLLSCFKNHKLKSPALSIVYAISLYSNDKKETALCQSQKILKLFEYTLEEYYTAKIIILLTDPYKNLKKLKRKDRIFCKTFSSNLPAFWNESFVADVSNLINEVCYE